MSDDYIKREDAKKWLTNLKEDCGRHQDLWHYGEALEQIIASLDADVAPVRHGRWEVRKIIEPQFVQNGYTLMYCSECGRNLKDAEYFDYCPNCGAKMEGGTDEK